VESIRYVRSGTAKLAYQVSGDGPLDLLLVPGFISHVDYAWREPSLARFLRQLGAFTRVIGYDKRGMGLSDRDPSDATPTMEQRVADVVAVQDGAESSRAALFAWSEGGPTAVRFAVEHPERVAALILTGTTARFSDAPDYPQGIPREVLELAIEVWQEAWGTGVALALYGPSVAGDPQVAAWWAAYQRFAATPGAVANSLRMHLDVDVRDSLPRVAAPTLILHRVDDMLVPVTGGRYLAEHIPGAVYRELPGSDHMYWLGEQQETLEAIKDFLGRTPGGAAIAELRRRRRRGPARGWESLTAAEMEVVRLVGLGLTNRGIAARLYVSPRTVQTHVGKAIAKLGVTSRSGIAAEVARRHHSEPQP
jgi:pimeloyl-ACP methyl ester carboxylesterase/DNA-binding CsgD family transcriptional regulator